MFGLIYVIYWTYFTVFKILVGNVGNERRVLFFLSLWVVCSWLTHYVAAITVSLAALWLMYFYHVLCWPWIYYLEILGGGCCSFFKKSRRRSKDSAPFPRPILFTLSLRQQHAILFINCLQVKNETGLYSAQ